MPKETQSLTTWKNEPRVQDLRNDLTAAMSAHNDQVAKITKWLDNLNITGSATINTPKGRSKAQPQLIRRQAEWRYAALSEPFLSTEDLFEVLPTAHDDAQRAHQNALILNNQFSTKLDKVHFIDGMIRQAVNTGTAIIRTGWEHVSEEVETEEPSYVYKPASTEEEMVAIKSLMDQSKADPDFVNKAPAHVLEAIRITEETGIPYIPVFDGMEKVTTLNIIKNQPSLTLCDFRNVIPDPTCQGIASKLQFVIYAFETSLDELNKDGRYSNLDNIDLEGVSPASDYNYYNSYTNTGFQFEDRTRKKFIAYEYWGYWDIDDEGTTKPIVATFVGETMIRLEESPFPDGKIPFEFISYLPVTGSLYGEPDGALLEDDQKVIGALTRGMIDVLGRSAAGQKGMAKGLLDDINLRKYENGLDYQFNAQQGDPRAYTIDHNFPELPQSALTLMTLYTQNAEALTGVRAFAGTNGGTALSESATAVRSAIDAASKREAGILRRLSKGITNIGRKIIAMNAEWLSDLEVVRITAEEFIEVDRKDLYGNYDITLTISTAEEDNQKAQEIAFLMQTMGNNLPWDATKILLSKMFHLRKMPEIAKQIMDYQPQPDPVEEQTSQLELLKLQYEIEKIKADTAKALADSRNKDSDTDLKNLEYIEEERGTNHERRKAEIAAQAQANLGVELVKQAADSAKMNKTAK